MNKRSTAVLIMLPVMFGILNWSCNMWLEEQVGHSTEALEAGFIGTNSGITSMEVSATWTPAANGNSEAVVIGYNDFTNGTQGGPQRPPAALFGQHVTRQTLATAMAPPLTRVSSRTRGEATHQWSRTNSAISFT